MKISRMKTAILLNSKVALTPQILAVLSSSNGHGKTNNQSVYFTRKWEDCGVVSDLWHHLMKHLGTNATNYFMYLWVGPVCSPGGPVCCSSSPLTPQVQAVPASQSGRCTALHRQLDLRSYQYVLPWPQGCA